MKPDIKTAAIVILASFVSMVVGLFLVAFIVSQQVEVPAPPVQIAATEGTEEEKSASREPAPAFDHLKEVAKELEKWRKDLTTEKERLMTMDKDIAQRESVLKAEKKALVNERQKIFDMQKQLESRILIVEDNETARYKDLAALFAKMKPDAVVDFLRSFQDDQVTKLLTFIPQKQLVKILQYWNSTFPDERKRIVTITSQMKKVIEMDTEQGKALETPQENTLAEQTHEPINQSEYLTKSP